MITDRRLFRRVTRINAIVVTPTGRHAIVREFLRDAGPRQRARVRLEYLDGDRDDVEIEPHLLTPARGRPPKLV